MTFFKKYPQVIYTFDQTNAVYDVVTDITLRIAARSGIKDNYAVYDDYDVKDEETPETVSYKFYGTTSYHWVILLMNDIIDPRYDWPLSQRNLRGYVESKYGSSDAEVYGTHHYIDEPTGIVVDSDYPGAVSISNMQYEEEENETKRRIKVLKPTYLDDFVTEFEALINNG